MVDLDPLIQLIFVLLKSTQVRVSLDFGGTLCSVTNPR